MPIHSCKLPEGGSGYQWGDHGHCYGSRSGAERQAAAAHAHGYAGDAKHEPRSEAQRRAMWAARQGNSKLDIPASVGREFVGDSAGDILINDFYNVPYGGGTSKDGKTIYIDWRIPKWMDGDGHFVDLEEALALLDSDEPVLDVHQAIAHHEHPEFKAMTSGDEYETAHRDHANPAEKAYVEGQGVNYDVYDKAVQEFLEENVEPDPNPELPPDLYLKPYGKGCRPISGDPQLMDLHKKAIAADQDCLSMDRASLRTVDQDGHLHVAESPISKANVCPYYGSEIPGAQELGLDPGKVYHLLRHPDELKKAAESFSGKPLLINHRPQYADDHEKSVTIGAIMNPQWDGPYLKAELVVWDGEAIKAIDSGEQKELSAGYRYRADMTPGMHEGVKYDGIMRDIVGNHVALVTEGRAGPDVVVGDNQLEKVNMSKKPLSRRATLAKGILMTALAPVLAKDAKMPDLDAILADVASDNWRKQKPVVIERLKQSTTGKLAKDAALENVVKMLDMIENAEAIAGADDWSDEEEEQYQNLHKKRPHDKYSAAQDEDEEERKRKEQQEKEKSGMDQNMVSKTAMDEAIARTRKEMLEEVKAIAEAQEIVRPYVGKVVAQDSAAGVYKTALDMLGVKTDGVHASAFRALLEAQPKPGSSMASDKKVVTVNFEKRFPELSRIRRM